MNYSALVPASSYSLFSLGFKGIEIEYNQDNNVELLKRIVDVRDQMNRNLKLVISKIVPKIEIGKNR